jgi:hypothetical protein
MDTEKIASIKIKEGDKIVDMQKNNGGFAVANKNGYPADTKKINQLITDTLDVKIQEKITDNSENFADLQIGEKAKSVSFFNGNDKLITGICIGKRSRELGGSYVRLIDSNEVFLAESSPRISTDPLGYLDKQIVSLDTKNIIKVTVTDSNGTYTITSEPNSTNSILQGIPEGKKAKGTDYEQVFSALSRISFTDVMKEKEGLTFDNRYICELSDKRIYKLETAEKNGEYFLKCEAEYTGPENIQKKRTKESEQELKKKEALLLAQDKVDEFNRKTSMWIYEISEYKAENLTKDLSELIEDIPEEKNTENGNSGEPNIPAEKTVK